MDVKKGGFDTVGSGEGDDQAEMARVRAMCSVLRLSALLLVSLRLQYI